MCRACYILLYFPDYLNFSLESPFISDFILIVSLVLQRKFVGCFINLGESRQNVVLKVIHFQILKWHSP